MLVYPPDNHETFSKTIFLIGSFKDSFFLDGEKIKAENNGNFSKLVRLKTGLNILNLEIDGKIFSRNIYRKAYPKEETKTLRDFTVKKNTIELPLKIDHSSVKISFIDPHHLLVRLSGLNLKFNSIRYTILEPEIYIRSLDSVDNTIELQISSRKEIKEVANYASDKYFRIKVHSKEIKSENDSKKKFKYPENRKKQYSIVCLDPGHGGSILGACSPQGISEKELNLELCLKIKQELKKLNIESALTRDTDIGITLEDRVKYSQTLHDALFISIHHNAVPDHCDPYKHQGFSCHYFHESSYDVAQRMAKLLKKNYPLKFAGIYKQDLHVLRENRKQDAILIEVGYLIHPLESILLTNAEFQYKSAKILAMAISEIVK